MFILIFFMDLLAACSYSGAFAGIIFTGLAFGIIGILLVISRQPQNRLVSVVFFKLGGKKGKIATISYFASIKAFLFTIDSIAFYYFFQICTCLFNARTSIYSSYCDHSEYLLDFQAKHIDIGSIHRLDDNRFDYVLLLWHNE